MVARKRNASAQSSDDGNSKTNLIETSEIQLHQAHNIITMTPSPLLLLLLLHLA